MYCDLGNMYRNKMYENNGIKLGGCCKVLTLYMKWYINIQSRL